MRPPPKLPKKRWIELGLDLERIPKRKPVHYKIAIITRLKLKTLAHFLGLDMSLTIDMATEALIQYINQRHLANGGDESGLLRFDANVINNDKFYETRRSYWGGRGVLAKPRNNEGSSGSVPSNGPTEDASNEKRDPS